MPSGHSYPLPSLLPYHPPYLSDCFFFDAPNPFPPKFQVDRYPVLFQMLLVYKTCRFLHLDFLVVLDAATKKLDMLFIPFLFTFTKDF